MTVLSRRSFLAALGFATLVPVVGLSDHFIVSNLRTISVEGTPIEELGLKLRLANGLKANHIATIGQLLSKSQDDLLRLPLIGCFCLGNIADMLVQKGFASRIYVDSKYPDARYLSSVSTQSHHA